MKRALLLLAACGGATAPAPTEAPTNRGSTGAGPTQPIALWVRKFAPDCPPVERAVTVFVDDRQVAAVQVVCPAPDPSGMSVRVEGFDANAWIEGPTLAIEHGTHILRAVDVAGDKRLEKELSATFPVADMKTLAVFIRTNALVLMLGDADHP